MAASTEARVSARDVRARNVWFVLVASTLLFCGLCAATGYTAYGFLSDIRRPEQATVQLVRGSQLNVLRRNRVELEAVPKSTALGEGDQVVVGADTEVNIDLFDGSTLHLYFNTRATLTSLRTSRFFGRRKEIRIDLAADREGDTGTAVLSTAGPENYSDVAYTIFTPHCEIDADPSSTVRVQVSTDSGAPETRASVSDGSATVLAEGGRVSLTPGNMTTVVANKPPSEVQPTEIDLVRNGDFTEPPTSRAEMVENGGLGTAAWLPIHDQSSDASNDGGSITVQTENLFRQSVRSAVIDRPQRGERYSRIGFRQDINQPASFLHSIELNATVKIVAQTEPVGGPQGDVFPLTIRVIYSDPNGKQHDWKHSFYYCTSGEDSCKLENATAVPLGRYTAPQLFVLRRSGSQPPPTGGGQSTPTASQPDTGSIGQDIATINSIEVYGIGNRFQSWITTISVLAR